MSQYISTLTNLTSPSLYADSDKTYYTIAGGYGSGGSSLSVDNIDSPQLRQMQAQIDILANLVDDLRAQIDDLTTQVDTQSDIMSSFLMGKNNE